MPVMHLLTTKPVAARGSLFHPASKCTAVRPCCISGAVLATSSPQCGSLESERQSWAASVRELTGRKKHRFWEPQLLDPPAALGDVSIVLLSPKRPSSVGAVARAASSFECEDLRIVSPRCDHLARAARNGSKGAQYLLWRAQLFEGLGQATAGAAITVAFTRWIQGRGRAFKSPAELFAAPELHHLITADSCEADTQAEPGGYSSAARQRRIMLVFGREESGLTEAELAACDYVCSIPIGRLQESLSLSHAVSVVLSQLYQLRLNRSGLVPVSVEELAAGCPWNESSDD